MRGTKVLPEGFAKESFIALLRRESVFAISEICKGLVILGVGDIATADQFGDAVVIACQTCGAYRLASLQPKSGIEVSLASVSLAIEARVGGPSMKHCGPPQPPQPPPAE